MGKELFDNIPSKVADLLTNVKMVVLAFRICNDRLFGRIAKSVTFWIPC